MKPFTFKGKEIKSPSDIRQLHTEELPDLCVALRQYIATIPTDKKAHLESSLGVTELTVALHYLLDTPADRLIWDVGHQTAVHKVLTGRGEAMCRSLRRLEGISGFPSPAESPYDLFYTGHSSTSISMALGLWLADKRPKTVAVIGDGALTGGQAFEALNIAGDWEADILVILNDNGLSIDPNVGALSTFGRYEDYFRALNFSYLGEVEGNNLPELLFELKKAMHAKGPRVLRVLTKVDRIKNASDRSAMLQPIRVSLRRAIEGYLQKHSDFYVLSPAMLAGAGLKELKEKFHDRVLDTGITEQACVSIAAGLAKGGKRVVVHIYSTFLQRAVDQLIHDVALQGLPILFIIDRAGLVGEDGPTHHGLFDLQVLTSIPNMKIHLPDSVERFASAVDKWVSEPHLSAIRIPRDSSILNFDTTRPSLIWNGSNQTLISVGALSHQAYNAYNRLISNDIEINFISVTSFETTSDKDLLRMLLSQKMLFLAEENYLPGSFTQHLITALSMESNGKGLPKIVPLTLNHKFITHGSPEELLHLAGLSDDGIYQSVIENLNT